MINAFSSTSAGETRFLCSIVFRSFRLGKSQEPKSTALAACFDSMIFHSGVSRGTFFVRLEKAFARICFPDGTSGFFSSAIKTGFFAFWILASFRSSSSAFFLYSESCFDFFIGTISCPSSDGSTESRRVRREGTEDLTFERIVRYEIRRVIQRLAKSITRKRSTAACFPKNVIAWICRSKNPIRSP